LNYVKDLTFIKRNLIGVLNSRVNLRLNKGVEVVAALLQGAYAPPLAFEESCGK
jgi:hypothetical protein